MRPARGRNPSVGFSVVIRHWSANPRWEIDSWRRPRSSSVRAACDQQLRADQVDVGGLLGDGVLDLDPRVHLDEHVLAALGVDQELDRSGVDVADLAGEADGVCAQRLAQSRDRGPARARARSASGGGAGPSSRARTGARPRRRRPPSTWTSMCRGRSDRLLEVHRPIAERALGLAHRRRSGILSSSGILDQPHAAAAAARRPP